MQNPDPTPKAKVTVICTVYNHEAYIEEALDSVKNQTYPSIELFIIDNGSADQSKQKISDWAGENSKILPRLILREEVINYCASFNEALFQSTGEYIIDLAGDDILLPGHIEASLCLLAKYDEAAASFSDAELEDRGEISLFYEKSKFDPPTQSLGDIYINVISQYCISTVTLVFRAAHLKAIGGYDENLVYEDFDVLCRLARKHSFCFSPHVGVRKRILPNSFSANQYATRKSTMLQSTLGVCRKISEMNITENENEALYSRVMYEAFHALGSANFEVAKGFLDLASQINPRSPKLAAFKLWQKIRLDLSPIYQKMK